MGSTIRLRRGCGLVRSLTSTAIRSRSVSVLEGLSKRRSRRPSSLARPHHSHHSAGNDHWAARFLPGRWRAHADKLAGFGSLHTRGHEWLR
jgi:hypothetical protein